MKVSTDVLLACFAISLLVTIVSGFVYAVTYMELGSPMDRDRDGCVVRFTKDDSPYSVCPDDTMRGRISAFLAPKAAVVSIVLSALIAYRWSKDAVERRI